MRAPVSVIFWHCVDCGILPVVTIDSDGRKCFNCSSPTAKTVYRKTSAKEQKLLAAGRAYSRTYKQDYNDDEQGNLLEAAANLLPSSA